MRLALVVAVLAPLSACNGAAEETTTTAADTTTTVEAGGGAEVTMVDISFQPDEITVQSGDTVTWTNQDGVTHTTTSEDDVWDSGGLSQSGSFSFTFDEPGTFTYFCQVHPGQMQATVIVER